MAICYVPLFWGGKSCISANFGPTGPIHSQITQSLTANWISDEKSGELWLKVAFIMYPYFGVLKTYLGHFWALTFMSHWLLGILSRPRRAEVDALKKSNGVHISADKVANWSLKDVKALFYSPIRWLKKCGNFKINSVVDQTISFLYCSCSKKQYTEIRGCLFFVNTFFRKNEKNCWLFRKFFEKNEKNIF